MYVVLSLIIVVIFIGLGETYRLGKDFKVIIRAEEGRLSHEEIGPFFIGGIDPSKHHVKVSIWQMEED